MGMFDKPAYLTGDEGYVQPGDTFWLHNARIEGTVTVGGSERPQAKLQVSHDRDGDRSIVWTSGTAIVGQVRRMDAEDREGMPMELRLDTKPSGKGNPTNILTPADQPPPSETETRDSPDF